MSGIPFSIINAFTTDTYGGNPAVAIIVQEFPESDDMQKIAANFNQPMAAFIRPIDHDSEVANFEIRWYTIASEVPLCGHATLASSGYLFATPSLVSPSVHTLRFRAKTGNVLTTRRLGDWIEIGMSAAVLQVPPAEEAARLKSAVQKGLGKEVTVKSVRVGGDVYESYLLAEVDEENNVAGITPDHEALLSTGYMVNIITSSSSDPGVSFVSRMFAPQVGVPEDPVCGSAHGLLGPYWSQKLAKGDTEMLAKQVSKRGGTLRVSWNEKENWLTLAGQTKIVLKGELLPQFNLRFDLPVQNDLQDLCQLGLRAPEADLNCDVLEHHHSGRQRNGRARKSNDMDCAAVPDCLEALIEGGLCPDEVDRYVNGQRLLCL
ncbi:hypothetical protein NM688_g7055 [Phlebia brevispora]|uniref:Uncharacterized protein n=1 Tax=Phlebia brevispora TaxID=194682 RepID=A0ACC1S9G3_9APHY|nr:hypothetical protein NM688_g7055 [Phlebia brevispora]